MVNLLPIDQVKHEVIDMYNDLPRNKRKYLYNLFLNNPNQPFHHGIQDGNGTWFHVATGDYLAPAATQPLDVIIDILSNSEGYTQEQIDSIYRVYYDKLVFIRDKPDHQVAAAAAVAAHDGIPLLAAAAEEGLQLVLQQLQLQQQQLQQQQPHQLQQQINPDILQAPHIGTLNIYIHEDDNHNSVSWDPFVDGEELVRLDQNNKHIYHIPDLQDLFNSRIAEELPIMNPLTDKPVTHIERFTLHLLNGGRYKKKTKNHSKSKNHTKTKKSRKTKAKKTRKH